MNFRSRILGVNRKASKTPKTPLKRMGKICSFHFDGRLTVCNICGKTYYSNECLHFVGEKYWVR